MSKPSKPKKKLRNRTFDVTVHVDLFSRWRLLGSRIENFKGLVQNDMKTDEADVRAWRAAVVAARAELDRLEAKTIAHIKACARASFKGAALPQRRGQRQQTGKVRRPDNAIAGAPAGTRPACQSPTGRCYANPNCRMFCAFDGDEFVPF